MGGRGASGKRSKASGRKVSALEVFKENARQFNEAKEAAKEARASKLEFTTVTGEKINFYWNVQLLQNEKLHCQKAAGDIERVEHIRRSLSFQRIGTN